MTVNSTVPCYRGGHHCNWPACPADCDGRPGRERTAEDIPALIERLRNPPIGGDNNDEWFIFRDTKALLDEAAAALQTLAHWHECERARADAAQAELTSETGHMNARITELEAERDAVREEAATCGKMCCLYAEEADANGQKSMSGCMIDSIAPFLVSIAYPLREMCLHEGLDAQAGVCRQCGINEEDIARIRALIQPEAEG